MGRPFLVICGLTEGQSFRETKGLFVPGSVLRSMVVVLVGSKVALLTHR